MLRYFRGGGVAKVLVGGIVLTIIVVFLVEFRSGQGPTAGLKQDCAVRYAGECLDQKDYFAAFGLVVPRGVESKAIARLGLRRKVLDGLAERELLFQQARKLGLGVSKDALEAELEAGRAYVSLPASEGRDLSANLGLCRLDASGSGCEPGTTDMVRQLRVRRTPSDPFDYKLYEREIRIVANRGPREFRATQERELLAHRLRQLVRSRVRVSEDEADFVAQRATIRSAVVNRDWFAKYAVDMTPAVVDRWAFDQRSQVDAAYEAEKANWTGGCPVIREIVVPPPEFALDQSDSSRGKADAARARLVAGEDFGMVAREVSAAPSAVLGGDVGCLSKAYGVGAEELLKAVESLKPGELSGVIETPRGNHIVQLVERLDPKSTEQAARQHLARTLYVRFAADEAARKFAEGLIAAVRGGQKLEEAVAAMSKAALPVTKAKPGAKPAEATEPAALAAPDRPRFEVSPAFGRSGNPLPDLEPKEAIAPKAFELGTADALYEKPIETTTGHVVIQLKELNKPEDSSKEKQEVMNGLWQVKADQAVARYVADLKRAAGDKLQIDPRFAEEKGQPGGAE